MAKYRKKPVVIEAFQYTNNLGDLTISVPRWFVGAILEGSVSTNGEVLIHTLEGKMTVSEGDYIIQGIQGEIYPCKPDIFEATYEAVEE